MTTLVMALYAEGRTDERFLPLIIQRTATQILAQHSPRVVDVLEPRCVPSRQQGSRAEQILQVARQTHGYHLLIVHADADASRAATALAERVVPGLNRVAQARLAGDSVCPELVPVVPVHMTEAWMLADADTLLDIIGTTVSRKLLNLPIRPQQVESIADPKQRLEEILRTALGNRTRRSRRRRNIGELYEPLAQQIELAQLELLPAYENFRKELTSTLKQLNFI